jgi:hypothetical protein
MGAQQVDGAAESSNLKRCFLRTRTHAHIPKRAHFTRLRFEDGERKTEAAANAFALAATLDRGGWGRGAFGRQCAHCLCQGERSRPLQGRI